MALNLSQEYVEQFTRKSACLILAQHIKSRLAQSGRRLARGTPESWAKTIVSRWSPIGAAAFCVLTDEKGFVSHSALAGKCGGSGKVIQDWWRRMKKAAVLSVPHDVVAKPEKLRLFKTGRECFWAVSGVKLQLNTEMLAYALGKHVTESTHTQTLATRQNYEGACDAMESDETKSEEERTEARRRMREDENKPDVPELSQAPLFDKKIG